MYEMSFCRQSNINDALVVFVGEQMILFDVRIKPASSSAGVISAHFAGMDNHLRHSDLQWLVGYAEGCSIFHYDFWPKDLAIYF